MKNFARLFSLCAFLAFSLGTAVAHEGHDHSHDAKSAVKSSAIDAKAHGAHGDKDCCKKGADGKSAKSECCKKHEAGEKQDCCKKETDAKAKAKKSSSNAAAKTEIKVAKRAHGTAACCKKAGTAEASECCKKHDAGIDQACCKKGLDEKKS